MRDGTRVRLTRRRRVRCVSIGRVPPAVGHCCHGTQRTERAIVDRDRGRPGPGAAVGLAVNIEETSLMLTAEESGVLAELLRGG